MTRKDDRPPAAPPDMTDEQPVERRIAFERLRERTDELELIISGLTVFALFALPEWLLTAWLRVQVHVEGELFGGLQNTFMFASGLSYALALAFGAHLAVRAYWVGLIGLKSVFPRGVRWDATPTMGPVSRRYFKRRLPDIDAAIDRADRFASIIFALSSLVAILIAWLGVIIIIMIALMSAAREFVGMSVAAGNILLIGMIALLMLLSLANWMVDTRVIRHESRVAAYPRLHRWIERSVRLTNAVLPQRLILPVQLTLQSNLPPRRFIVGFAIAIALVPIVGTATVQTRILFAPVNSYAFFDDEVASVSMRSAYYESMRTADDSGLHLPTIPSDRVADAYLRLFLPHLPALDNALLRDACPTVSADASASTASGARHVGPDTVAVAACLAVPWRVRIDGQDYPVADFVPAERRDLGTRGLQGYLPLAGFVPGRHDLVVTWNESGPADGRSRAREYRIPFWFAPAYELGLEIPSAPSGQP